MNAEETDLSMERRARRRALGAGALALAAIGAPAGAAVRPAGAPLRARWRLHGDFVLSMEHTNLIPFTQTVFDEGTGCTLEADGRVRIDAAGLFRVSLRTDWVAQAGLDIDLRKVNIRYQPATRDGRPPPIRESDERIAAADTPACSVPRMARLQVAWEPGTLVPSATATLQLTLAAPTPIVPGDLVFVSHSALCDACIGQAATDALQLQGRVVGPNTVRVTLSNPFTRDAVVIPAGQLNVLAMTSVFTAGESTDAYQTLHTATEPLQAGERIYASCYSHTPGDYLQSTKATWLQVERLA